LRALLLAAGLGTRLRPLTNTIPKCLVPIQGKPLLEYWLIMLRKAEVFPILINLHHKADTIRSFILDSPYGSIVSLVYEEKLLGTAGTLRKNQAFFGNEPMMLIHADNLSKFEVSAFIESHCNRPNNCDITMMTFTCPTPQTCGIVDVDNQGIVQAFYEKVENPPGNLANGAVYILEPSVVEFINSFTTEVIDFSTQILPHYMGRINTFHNKGYHRDIGTVDSLAIAQTEYSGSTTD